MQKVFLLSFVFILGEGILRKWLLPGYNTQLFALKYIFAGGMVLSYLISEKEYKSNHLNQSIKVSYFLLVLIVCLSIFTSVFSVKIWLVGVLSYLGFSIFLFVTPLVIDSRSKFETISSFISFFSFFAGLIAIIQYYLPGDHIINGYATTDLKYVAEAGGRVRVTSIFNYIMVFSTFINFAFCFILPKFLFEKAIKKRILLFVCLLVVVFSTFATGSRLTVSMLLLQFIIAFIIHFYQGYYARILLWSAGIITFSVAFSILGLFDLAVFDSVQSFSERANSVDDSAIGRVIWMMNSVFDAVDVGGTMGLGAGCTTQIAIFLGESILQIQSTFPLDQPIGRIIYEIGIVGVLTLIILKALIVVNLFGKFLKFRDKYLQLVSILVIINLIQYLLFFNNIVFNWMGAVNFWFGIGLFYSIWNVDRSKEAV